MDMHNTYESTAKKLRTKREALISEFVDGHVENFMPLHTAAIDEYFLESFEKSMVGPRLKINKNPYAIVALGGYGRKEQCVFSDVDILFLFEKRVPPQAEELIREILYPLWDLGLDIGHAVRSIKDCTSLAAEDPEVLTSLMDARYICGMSPLCSQLSDRIRRKILSRGAKKAVTELIKSSRARHHVCGDASYLLEPDLKEGQGGLRDYHSLLWLARIKSGIESPRDLEYQGVLSHDEFTSLNDALSFIWNVRSRLHLATRRKCDRLHFEYQNQMAESMGFGDRGGHKGVELFLGKLQGHMETIKQQHRMYIYELENSYAPKKTKPGADAPQNGFELKRGLLTFSSHEKIPEDPELLIRIFEESARAGIPLCGEAKRIVRDFGRLVDEDFRKSESAVKSFENILALRNPDFDVLDEMLHTGFLVGFVPELGRVLNRIEYDAYHHYPVDKHLLITVRTIKELACCADRSKDELFMRLYEEISDKKVLLWAALLHDIGKCEPKKDHSSVGAEMAADILGKMGYSEKEVETASFLVGEHLLLIKTATRRDIEDERTAIFLAREIGDEDCLKMLYLLTVGDLMATGKSAWNDWVLSLLRDLFMKVLRILQKGELATEKAAAEVAAKKETVLLSAGSAEERKTVESICDILSPRYLLYMSAGDIVGHIALYRSLKDEPVVWRIEKDDATDTRAVTVCAKDSPGLFSRIAGVFALHNLDILEAQAYTWRNGTALDIFKVRPPLDKLFEDEKWSAAERDLKSALSGNLDLRGALCARSNSSKRSVKPLKGAAPPPKVAIDNESSGFFTIIEVYACDEPGLLFKLTDTLYRKLELDIWIAKVATRVDQVVDVFYVRDMFGQKIHDDDRVALFKRTIEEALEAPEGAGLCVA